MIISGLYSVGFITLVSILAVVFLNSINCKAILRGYIIFGISYLIGFFCGLHLDRGQEYQIELLTQNKVKVISLHSGLIYYCAPEQIQEVLEKDNM